MQKSGRVLLTSDLGNEYSLEDVDGELFFSLLLLRMPWFWVRILVFDFSGRRYPSVRSIKSILKLGGWNKTADYIPEFLAIPKFLVNSYFGRFWITVSSRYVESL